jgi:hypothetical protein
MVVKALTSVRDGKDDVMDHINSGLDKLNTALEFKNLPVDDVLEAINLVQANADNQDILENLAVLNEWAKEQYTQILKGELKVAPCLCVFSPPRLTKTPRQLDHPQNARALSGMGNCHLTLANYWLGRVDSLEEESAEGKTELNEEETKASEQLKQGDGYAHDI